MEKPLLLEGDTESFEPFNVSDGLASISFGDADDNLGFGPLSGFLLCSRCDISLQSFASFPEYLKHIFVKNWDTSGLVLLIIIFAIINSQILHSLSWHFSTSLRRLAVYIACFSTSLGRIMNWKDIGMLAKKPLFTLFFRRTVHAILRYVIKSILKCWTSKIVPLQEMCKLNVLINNLILPGGTATV